MTRSSLVSTRTLSVTVEFDTLTRLEGVERKISCRTGGMCTGMSNPKPTSGDPAPPVCSSIMAVTLARRIPPRGPLKQVQTASEFD